MPAVGPDKYLVNAGWDDVPHLAEDVKAALLRDTPPYLRDARSKGTPSLGSGAIFPIEESAFVIPPFQLPDYFPRVYALDVGWNRTAALWGAFDREQGVLYLYAEHYRGQAEPSVHASAIKARGDWMRGVIDPAANGRSQIDGQRLMANYQAQGLHLFKAENSVEAGLQTVLDMLSTGRLKVFSTLVNWRAEYRLYRRDEKGAVIKKNDHLMDDTRYLCVSGINHMTTRPAPMRGQLFSGVADQTTGY